MPPEDQIQKTGLTEFVGGVTDGLYGAAAFDFVSPHDQIRAKKSWFFFDEEYICLGTGLESGNSGNAVATTINQCLLDGEVTINGINGKTTLPPGSRKLEKVNWIYHDSIGYYIPHLQNINLLNQSATGTWFSINRQTSSSKAVVKKDVFKLWLDHGISPSNGSYEYVVLPASAIEDVEKYADRPPITVLSNTTSVQAVCHMQLNIVYAVFYQAGSIKTPDNLTIGIDSPCMVMIRRENDKISSITVSDPTRKLSKLNISLNIKIDKSGDHFRTIPDNRTGTTKLEIDMPQEKFLGKSIVLKL
jgi:chondroitin AC lyase